MEEREGGGEGEGPARKEGREISERRRGRFTTAGRSPPARSAGNERGWRTQSVPNHRSEGGREGEKLWNLRRRCRHSPPQLLSRDLFERMLGERPPSQHCEPKWMDRSPVSGIKSFRHVDTLRQKTSGQSQRKRMRIRPKVHWAKQP